jgi:MerR-like DNA binding protein
MNMNCERGPYSAAAAAKYAGLSKEMVDYLCRQELVVPGCACKRGRGSRRHYSFGEVVALRVVARLCEGGVSVLRLKESLCRLREYHPAITLQSLPASHIVADGRHLYLVTPGKSIDPGKSATLGQTTTSDMLVERANDGQFAFSFVIALERIRDEVVHEITKAESA